MIEKFDQLIRSSEIRSSDPLSVTPLLFLLTRGKKRKEKKREKRKEKREKKRKERKEKKREKRKEKREKKREKGYQNYFLMFYKQKHNCQALAYKTKINANKK